MAIMTTELDEPELRPEFIKKMKKIAKQPSIHVGTVENLKKLVESLR